MKDKHSLVSEMSDSEFVSFLYSERDRENNLSQFQGWNNWAIAGALATIIYNIFTIWRSEIWLSPDIMLYAFSATMALYLFIKAFAVQELFTQFVKRIKKLSVKINMFYDNLPGLFR